MDDLTTQPVAVWRKLLTYTLVSLLAAQPLLPAFAAGVTVANGNTQLDQAGNGVPVVNIATPNQAGISHNQYNDFNVGQQGLILNNATGKLTQTQLGGLIQNNPNLQPGKEAQGIINEVVSANRSQLNGYMEVAGKAANVIVANPYGITCNGCGFLNTPNATLTTGKPVLGADGSLQSLEVTQGAITVEGKGLDASQSDAFSLVSRAAQINAGLYAKDLKVTVGANHVDAQGRATPLTAENAPQLAIDTGALGGMYANRIHLVSSDKGVGVNLGNLNSSVGDMQIDASGKLALGNATSNGKLTANAQQIALSGKQQSNDAMTLNSQGDISAQNAALTSGQNMSLNAQGQLRVDNASTLDSVKDTRLSANQLNLDGSVRAGQNLQLSAANLNAAASGKVSAQGNVTAQASDGGQWLGSLTAGDGLQLNTGNFTNGGQLAANGNLQLTANSLSNSGLIQAQSNQNISTNTLSNSGKLQSGGAFTLQGNQADNQGTIGSQRGLSLNLRDGLTVGDSGTLFAGDGLDITTGQLALNGAASGKRAINIKTSGLTSGQNGLLSSNGDISLVADNAVLNGSLLTDGGLTLNAGDLTTGAFSKTQTAKSQNITVKNTANLNGAMDAGDALNLSAATLNASKGAQISAQSDAALTASRMDLDARLSAGKNVQLQGNSINSGANAQVSAQQNIGLLAKGNSLWNGSLIAGKDLLLNAGDFTSNGTLAANNNGQLQVQNLTNGGLIQALGTESFSGNSLNNLGKMQSGGIFTLNAGQLNNQGTLGSQTGLTFNVDGLLKNAVTGSLYTDGLLNVTAGQLQLAGNTQGQQGIAAHANSLTTGDGSSLTSSGDIALTADNASLNGYLSSEGKLGLTTGQLTTGAASQTQARQAMDINATQQATLQGSLTTPGDLHFTGDTLNNAAILGANNIDLKADNIGNQGNISADNALNVQADALTQQGTLQAQNALNLSGKALNNSGKISGGDLTANYSQNLNNQAGGQLAATRAIQLDAAQVTNGGTLAGKTLALNASGLTNSGLIQGNDAAALSGDSINNSATGRVLTGGTLTLQPGALINQGRLQGDQLTLTANSADNQGTLLGSQGLNAQIGGDFNNRGSLMTQGAATVNANTLENSGQWLSEGDSTLTTNALSNSGELQGNNLKLSANTLNNSGDLIGVQALAVQLQHDLNNATGGKMLTQGAMALGAGNVVNNGVWQAKDLQLTAGKLDLNGAIQTANTALLNLSGDLNTKAQGNIVSGGTATLNAANLSNQGNWSANNLQLKANSLNNAGNISGVNQLGLTLSGALQQQQGATLLTGGDTTIAAGSIDNGGQLAANGLTLNTQSLTNRGEIKGQRVLNITTPGNITNLSGGTLRSQGSMGLNAQQLLNQGQIQSDGDAQLSLSNNLNNQGNLLSGGTLTANAPTISNSGQLQSNGLTLGGGTLNNGGTVLAQNSGGLGMSQVNNWGTLQGGALQLNGNGLSNSGTVLGGRQLGINVQQTDNQANGKLSSGGDLTLITSSLNPLGSVIALGNLTLQLANGFNQQGTLAAGDQLSLSTQGDLVVNGLMQGNGIQLNAGGNFTNNGQLRGGNGNFNLNAASITQNGNGSVQSGGDVRLTSRSGFNNNGFIGTAGSLVMSAVGQITNTALLYAGNDLQLLADSINNYRGDILAGNSLWMMRDGSGAANSQVVNTSGNIETTNGDITINTGHLLNQRDGLSSSSSYQAGSNAGVNQGQTSIKVRLGDLDDDEIGVYETVHHHQTGGSNGIDESWPAPALGPTLAAKTRKFLVGSSTVAATANGGASRIAANRNLNFSAGTLDNIASNVLAGGNITLFGNSLNNQSFENSVQNEYLTYQYNGASGISPQDPTLISELKKGNTKGVTYESGLDNILVYNLTGAPTYENINTGDAFRSVIQAGGAVNANFSNNISNTNTTAFAGGINHQLSAPSLQGKGNVQAAGGANQQQLAGATGLTIGTPAWNDSLSGALKQLGNSAFSLADYPLPTSNNGLFVPNQDPNSLYLITTNPKLNGLGQLDNGLFADLNAFLAQQKGTQVAGANFQLASFNSNAQNAGQAPRETRPQYTDETQFLGSAYFMDRLNLKPDYDYKFLGDAAFDTRYISNAVLHETGQRYINGVGSDLQQMQTLINNAASEQSALGLQIGVSLTPEQVAALTKSIVWWEKTTVNGQTVLAPKLYLAANDTSAVTGSVISGNTVNLDAGHIVNAGSTLQATSQLAANSQSSLDNLDAGLIKSNGGLQLSAIGDINNLGSSISGKTVALETLDGDINNITQTQQWNAAPSTGKNKGLTFSDTLTGDVASITASDGLSLSSGNNINNAGAKLSAGSGLQLDALNDVNITANALNSDKTALSGYNGRNATRTTSSDSQGSDISSGGIVDISAGHDLNLAASAVNAKGDASLSAGNDINLTTMDKSSHQSTNNSQNDANNATRSSVSSGGNLDIAAGRDLNSQAAQLAADLNSSLSAGRDVNLSAQQTSTYNEHHGSKDQHITETVRQQGSDISSGGSTSVIAGRDINTQAAEVKAVGDLALNAGRDVNIATAKESDYQYDEETKTKKGMFSSTTTHTVKEDASTTEKGTLLSGDNVSVVAKHDLNVTGSAIAGDGQVGLKAGNDVNIVAATEEQSSYRLDEKKKSGLFSGGGIGITVGSVSSKHELNSAGTTQSQSVSTVGSTGGNLSVVAGGKALISGADLIAGKDMSITGDRVQIDPGKDTHRSDEKTEQKSSGITLALSGTVGSSINQAVTSAQQAKQEGDGRLAALQGAKAALSGVQASQASQLAEAKNDTGSMIGISISAGMQKSSSSQHQEQVAVNGSTLNAGNNLTVTATGTGSSTHSGDIAIAGSQLKAGGDTTLDASRDILLGGAANTQLTEGSNKSSGGNIGVSLGVSNGGQGGGLSVFANANASKGNNKGNGTTWTETTLDSGKTLNLHSGRDTSLVGAQANADTINADVGRNLTLQSQQDTDRYDSKQQSISGGVSVAIIGAGGSASLSVSSDKMHSNFDSVNEQTGLYAGKGGFDLNVGNHTQLDGAVISSTASADKNSLDTGTLGFSDIHNQADYKVDHQGGGYSSGGPVGAQIVGNMASALLSGINNSGHAEGSTQAAISAGTITVRDQANQQQNVADLSRDTEHANGSITPIFDKEKEQKRLEQTQLISEVSSQVADVVRTQGQLKAIDAGKAELAQNNIYEPAKNAPQKEWDDYNDAVAGTKSYQETEKSYGTGSPLQRGIQAATAAIQGLAGGDIQSAIAGASAPYIATLIHKLTEESNPTDPNGEPVVNREANLIAHAVLGAVVAQIQGNSALSGASGATIGEFIAQEMYPGVKRGDLTEEQRQTISSLSTLAAGLAGGLTGDSSANIVAGAQAGKNAVENNLLGGSDEGQIPFAQEHAKNVLSCSTDPGSASCQKGLAMNDALMIALPAGLGGGLLAAATPEIAAAAKAAIQACAGNVVLCLNNAGIQMSEAIVPGGVGAGGAVGIGKTVTEATTAKAEAAAANAAKNIPSDVGKINAGKFGQIELNSLSKTGANIDPAAKSGNFTVAGRALQKHGSREGSVYPVAKGTPAQINEQGQKILEGIVKAPGSSVKEGNRFGGFDVIAPDGRGARFDPQGNFRGFLEP